jgi:protein-S-isoprenylcysteine O-methyltransferase Ste14
METRYTVIAYGSWVALVLVWLPGYFASKRSSSLRNPALQLQATALLVICFLLLFNPRLHGLDLALTPHSEMLGMTGVAIDLAGVGFAIWARLVLGRNWSGMVMTVKEGHELVQSGPYSLLRHPIYTGLLLAILGTALTLGTLASYLAVVAGLAALIIRVRVEERLMSERFRETHEAYRQRTKKLIPFLW